VNRNIIIKHYLGTVNFDKNITNKPC